MLNNTLIRNILVLTGGTAGAQMITLLASPIITRLYTPEAMGYLGSFTAIVAILLPIAAFSLPIAIVLPKKNSEAISIAKHSLAIACIFSLALTLVLLICKDELAGLVNMAGNDSLFIAITIPVAVLISTVLSICTQWVIRHQLFKISAKAIMAQSVVINALKIAGGLVVPFGKTLIVLSIVAASIHSLFLFLFIRDKANPALAIPIGVNLDAKIQKKYKEFVKYRGPQVLANVNQNIPVVLLAILFGPVSAGLYTLCRTILILPITLVAKSINDVIYPKINQAYNEQQPISPLISKATLGLALLALPPLLLFIIFGPSLFSFIFGDNWVKSGVFAQWLTIWFYFNFVNRACVAAIPVLKMEAFLLLNSVLNFIMSSVGFMIGYFVFSNEIYAIAIYSILGIVPQIVIISYVIISARKHDKKLVSSPAFLPRS